MYPETARPKLRSENVLGCAERGEFGGEQGFNTATAGRKEGEQGRHCLLTPVGISCAHRANGERAMNIVETILNSQGGQTAQNLAKQFGLDPQQVTNVIQNAVPQLVNGIKTQVQQNGVQGLLGALQSGQHTQYLQNAASAFSSTGLADGQKILSKMLGDPSAVTNLINQVGAKTGIDTSTLQQMIPAVAGMVMGSIGKAQGLAGGAAGAALNSPLGQMAGGLLGKLTGGGAAGGGQGAAAGLMSLLDANKDGSIADDLMGMANKFLKR